MYRARVSVAPPRTVAQLSGWGQPVAGEQLRTGDLVVFGKGRAPHHAGIYVGEGRFVHASNPRTGVRTDALSSKYYAARFEGAKTVLG